ncbi:MAG: type II toxin-antitoxin system VapC family toxin [Deltaproteobacteria bacterium]|jgi:tRNA(fMet)-specific endonuclease VapC|nr:type II toxin-antitoxin system VapC family toxin [Deltaproteobacteria bacterium]
MTNAPRFMLGTNICIYIQRHKPPSVLARFKTIKPGQAAISVITWGELLYGAAKSQQPKQVVMLLEEFSDLVPVLQMPSDCGKSYGQIRADLKKTGRPIGNNDLWIAAHALASGLTLITNNTKEFERVPHLKIENWI